MVDLEVNRRRRTVTLRDSTFVQLGFGFVTYATSAMVDRLMSSRPHILDAREIEPKRAVPREESGKPESSLSAKKLFVGGIREGAVDESDMKEYFCKVESTSEDEPVIDPLSLVHLLVWEHRRCCHHEDKRRKTAGLWICGIRWVSLVDLRIVKISPFFFF